MLWIWVAKLTLWPEVPSDRVGLWQMVHSCVLLRVPPWTNFKSEWQEAQLARLTTWRRATTLLLSTLK
ncbi:MAG: hypothetical protein WDO73_02010 [Ignavibacteriota bacterium]